MIVCEVVTVDGEMVCCVLLLCGVWERFQTHSLLRADVLQTCSLVYCNVPCMCAY